MPKSNMHWKKVWLTAGFVNKAPPVRQRPNSTKQRTMEPIVVEQPMVQCHFQNNKTHWLVEQTPWTLKHPSFLFWMVPLESGVPLVVEPSCPEPCRRPSQGSCKVFCPCSWNTPSVPPFWKEVLPPWFATSLSIKSRKTRTKLDNITPINFTNDNFIQQSNAKSISDRQNNRQAPEPMSY